MLDQECYTAEHSINSIAAVAVMLMFCIGYPVYVGARLLDHYRSDTLHDSSTRKQYLFLYHSASTFTQGW